jgi:integrase
VAKSLDKAPGDVTPADARRLLSQRLGKIANGEPIMLRAERVRVGELLDDLLVEYQANDRRSIERAKYSVAHLRGFFGDARAQTLDPALVSDYVVRRKATRKADEGTEIPGATNGTINRELAALKRALTLAVQRRKILTRPYIPLLAENNARQGFFEHEQLTAVLRHLPEAIRPVASFAYLTGWRLSEIINLTWRQVDFGAATVRLEPGTTKNRAGRMFPFTPELRALLEAQRAATAAVRAKTERIIPNVFHRGGEPIKSFRRACRSEPESARLCAAGPKRDRV